MQQQAAPPWPVMVLVAEYLEPHTLSVASCVSKSWSSVFSSDHLWKSHCLSHYPAASVHLNAAAADDSGGASPRRIFFTLHAASKRRRQLPPAPRISLRDLIFTVDVFGASAAGGSRRAPLLASLAKPGEELRESTSGCGLFRFDVEVESGGGVGTSEEELRVVWMAIMKGYRGAFAMMDKVGKGRFVGGGTEMWFSEELPHAGVCCAHSPGSRHPLQSEVWLHVADDVGGVGGDGEERDNGAGRRRRRVIRKMTLGLMSTAAWRYVGINDALLYLQRYLLPSSDV